MNNATHDWPDSVPNSIRSESLLMQALLPWIGGLAAILTSLSYIPQLQKAWPRGSTQDISLKMLAILTAGLVLWIGYGILKGDWVIILANGVGAALSGTVLGCKLRDINAS
jgi:MtN3 and saliva related transmembrane protein